MPIIQNLEVVSKQYKIYRNIKSKRMFSFDAFSMPNTLEFKQNSASASNKRTDNDLSSSLSELMQVNLAQDLHYLALCIDENKNVIKSYGDTTKFLLAEHFTTNLEKLLPKKLAMVFHTMSNNVIKTGEKAVLNRIKIKQDDSFMRINLSISPLEVKGNGQKLLMVTFIEDKSSIVSEHEAIDFNEKVYHDEYTLNLEEELKELKERLKSTYEQLDASNENMQSFNEEMISANEEMQSTNEEMQSVNEELDTINSEYQLKNKELLDINDDLNNYFRSNINGQLFINKDLLLMKFSPGTVKQINLLDTDIGRPLSNITTNIKFETIIDDIKQVLKNGEIITKEIETNNGKWYQVMTMPYVRQSDHKNSGAILTFNDITELKKVQQELDVSNRTLAMALDSAEMGIFSIDVNTKIFTPSPRMKEFFGYLVEQEMSYEDAVARIGIEYKALFTDGIKNSISKGEKMDIEFSVNLPTANKPLWLRSIGNLVYNGNDKPVYFAGLLNDVTIHKEDEIRKNDFIAMASHELRNPLTTLHGYIQLMELKMKNTSEDFMINSLQKARIQVKKMNALINSFLNTSSFEAGKINLDIETFELNNLLKETIADTKVIVLDHKINLITHADCLVTADRDKIGQVINNLITNAAKYSPIGTTIEISFKIEKKTVRISLKDEGMGINEKDQEKIFDRYYRVNDLQTRKVSGFGLGLYLSAEIIKLHKGKIWLNSEIGKGSTFYFSLPI